MVKFVISKDLCRSTFVIKQENPAGPGFLSFNYSCRAGRGTPRDCCGLARGFVDRGLDTAGWFRGLRLGPGIVGADAPEVAFRVAAGEGAASVGHVGDVEDDVGLGGFGYGVDGIGVVDDKAGPLG